MSSADEEHTDPGAAAPGEKVTVVAIDFSPGGRRALRWALEHVVQTGGALHAVHVVDRHWRASDLRADVAALTREMNEVERMATAELRALVAEHDGRAPAIHEHVTVGKPAEEIVRVARELGAETIVIGSHGLDAIAHLLVGSVAERVVRTAPCTVVVVKA
ncbi:MAG: universal stress protein [Deltaproteobacteria bacterium]|nr:universal stress protein [Kofleriaceae bacterium]